MFEQFKTKKIPPYQNDGRDNEKKSTAEQYLFNRLTEKMTIL